MDLRKGSEKDDNVLGNFTALLEFRGALFPCCKDVICHYLYQLQSKPKNQRKAKAGSLNKKSQKFDKNLAFFLYSFDNENKCSKKDNEASE